MDSKRVRHGVYVHTDILVSSYELYSACVYLEVCNTFVYIMCVDYIYIVIL